MFPDKQDYKTINPRLETITNCKVRLGLKNVVGKLVVHDKCQTILVAQYWLCMINWWCMNL
jgi:hypothetical protein